MSDLDAASDLDSEDCSCVQHISCRRVHGRLKGIQPGTFSGLRRTGECTQQDTAASQAELGMDSRPGQRNQTLLTRSSSSCTAAVSCPA